MDEARRKKEAEKASLDAEKKKELDSYLKHHFKGALPPTTIAVLENMNTNQQRSSQHESDRVNSQYDNGGYGGDSVQSYGSRMHNANVRGRDAPPSPISAHLPPNNIMNLLGKPANNASQRNDIDNRGNRNDNGYSGQEGNGAVPQREYDALSRLCEQLQQRQDELCAELEQQAEIIGVSYLTIRYIRNAYSVLRSHCGKVALPRVVLLGPRGGEGL